MDNQNQTSTPSQQKPHRVVRNSLIVFAMLVLSAVGYMSYRNPTLFSAAITGGSTKTVDTDLYIPSDYKSTSGDIGYVEMLAGKALQDVTKIDLTLGFDKNKVSISSVEPGSALPIGSYTLVGTPSGDERYNIMLTFLTPADINVNDKLVKIKLSLASGLSAGDKISLWKDILSINAAPAISRPSFTPGEITIGTAEVACIKNPCGEHATCDLKTGDCICYKGYDQKFNCTACDETNGYTGYPDCKKDALINVTGIVLTFSNDTIGKLTTPDRVQAYSTAYVMINSPSAAGKTIHIENVVPDIIIPASTTPDCVSTPAQKKICIQEITSALRVLLAVPGVNVSADNNSAGLLKLQAVSPNADMSLDGISTTSGDVTIVPGLENKIILNPTASYQLKVIGKNTDGSAADINFNNLKWQPQPVNRLDSNALAGGLLEKGDKSGVTPLYAQIEKTNGTKIDSNQITVEVPSGPIVEYIHRIGSDPIVRGGRVLLSTKISDVDQISDIKDIRTSIVRSTQTTYAGISGDATAVWFTATPVITEVATTENGTQEAPAGEEESPPPPPTTEYYRIYSIPVEIPQDENLTDSPPNNPYKLILELTDTLGHVASSVLPINIGAVATGDVDGNGTVNMLDVIAAFQIANGTNATPTQTALQAADIDNNGKVTMLDVITLFNQLK